MKGNPWWLFVWKKLFPHKMWKKLSNRCNDLQLILKPHLLIFSIKGLEKSRTKGNEQSTLMDLPNDFLFDVLARLPVKSLCHIRSVSKTALSIVDDPFFATLHLLNPATNTAVVEEPQLMLLTHSWSYGDGTRFAFQSLKYRGEHNLTKSKHRYSQIFSQLNYEFDFVFCNLFCFKVSDKCLLVNPLREEVLHLKLPINDLVPTYVNQCYGMGFDSVTRTHKIVCIFESGLQIHKTVAYVYTLGTRSLSQQKIHSVPQCEFSSKNVSAYGDMHWLIHRDVGGGNPNRIISFNFEKDEFVWTPYPDSSHGLNAMHLLNVGGCLAIMSYEYSSIKIWVMKNYEKKVWELDYKIDNKILPHYLRSIETCGEWEHGIFFTQESPDMFYFWDVRDKSIKYIKAETLLPGIFSYDTLHDLLWDEWRHTRMSIFRYTDSLISLKTFGNLVERQVCRGQNRGH